jgi:hypothetical protein
MTATAFAFEGIGCIMLALSYGIENGHDVAQTRGGRTHHLDHVQIESVGVVHDDLAQDCINFALVETLKRPLQLQLGCSAGTPSSSWRPP